LVMGKRSCVSHNVRKALEDGKRAETISRRENGVVFVPWALVIRRRGESGTKKHLKFGGEGEENSDRIWKSLIAKPRSRRREVWPTPDYDHTKKKRPPQKKHNHSPQELTSRKTRAVSGEKNYQQRHKPKDLSS